MYAVIISGGKQHRVKLNQTLKLEKLKANVGEEVTFNEVLLVVEGDQVQVGQPLVESVVVKAVVKEQMRDKKINIIKFKRRKHSMKRMGHRQDLTVVEITQIGDHKAEAKPAPKKEAAPKAEVTSDEKKPAAKKPAAEEKKPAVKKPAAEDKKPAAKKPAAEDKKPADKKPAAKKPAAKKPAAEDKKPAAKKPAAKKPAAKKPAAKKTEDK